MPFKREKWPFLTPAAAFCLLLGISAVCPGCSKDEKSADKAAVETTRAKKTGDKTQQGKEDTGHKRKSGTKAANKGASDDEAATARAVHEKMLTDETAAARKDQVAAAGVEKVPAEVKVTEPVNTVKALETRKPAEAEKAADASKAADPAKLPSPTTQKTVATTAADPSRPVLPDPRLLLTMADIEKIAPAKAKFRRSPLPGVPRTEDTDSIFYTPEKGNNFGFAVQLFRSKNAQDTKKRFETFQASYPSTQEIAPVSGKTFFSYWNEVLHIGFVHPSKNLVVVVSGGRSFCDGEKLMELAGRIAERLK